jgi:hypothetical protein
MAWAYVLDEWDKNYKKKKTLLGQPRRKWEDDIKIDLREVCCDNGSGQDVLRIVDIDISGVQT